MMFFRNFNFFMYLYQTHPIILCETRPYKNVEPQLPFVQNTNTTYVRKLFGSLILLVSWMILQWRKKLIHLTISEKRIFLTLTCKERMAFLTNYDAYTLHDISSFFCNQELISYDNDYDFIDSKTILLMKQYSFSVIHTRLL